MKHLFIAAACVLLVACHANTKLSADEAKLLIEKDFKKRGPAAISISTVDEQFLSGIKESKLVKDGYIIFLRNPGAYQPRIQFSGDAGKYLLQQENEHTKRFRMANRALKAILEIKLTPDGKQAAAQYVYNWKNPTPFFELLQAKEDQTNIAYFSREESGWVLSEKPSMEQKSLSF